MDNVIFYTPLPTPATQRRAKSSRRNQKKPSSPFEMLPLEILTMIVKYLFVKRSEIKVPSHHPQGAELDLSFGQVNKHAREVFFGCLRKEHLFVNLKYYRPDHNVLNVQKQTIKKRLCDDIVAGRLLSNITINRKQYEDLKVPTPSVIELDAKELPGLDESCSRNAFILVDKWQTLLLAQLVQQWAKLRGHLWLTFDCKNVEGVSNMDLAKALLEAMAKLVRGVDLTIKNMPSQYSDLDIQRFQRTMTVESSFNPPRFSEAVPALLSQLLDIKTLDSEKEENGPLHFANNMPLLAGALFPFYRIASQRIHIAHHEVCVLPVIIGTRYLLRSFTDYLLSSKNSQAMQRHYCLLKDKVDNEQPLAMMMLISEMIRLTVDARILDPRQDYTLQQYLLLLEAYAEFQLALVRAGTLPGPRVCSLISYGPGSHSRQRRMLAAQGERFGRLRLESNLTRAKEVLGTILRKGTDMMFAPHGSTRFNLRRVVAWSDLIQKLFLDIEEALRKRSSESLPILVDPIPEICKFHHDYYDDFEANFNVPHLWTHYM